MRSVAVLSAVFGGFDVPGRVVEQSVPCEWVMVCDGGWVADEAAGHGWSVVVEPPGGLPRARALVPKLCPWRYVEADVIVWLDGAAQVTSPSFVEDAVACLGDSPLAAWRHPCRSDVVDEAKAALLESRKYQGQPLVDQALSYTHRGLPRGWGLWACTYLVWGAGRSAALLSSRWTAEVAAWSLMDQVSLPWVLWGLGIRPVELPGELHANPWVQHRGHLANR